MLGYRGRPGNGPSWAITPCAAVVVVDRGHGAMRILVIEDDARLAAVIARLLRQERFDVDLAADGVSGQDLALTGNYDALIIDRMLPEQDGMAVLRALRAAHIATPALMLTARSRPPER